MGKRKLDTQYVVELYQSTDLGMAGIARVCGSTRQAVHKVLKRAGVARQHKGTVSLACAFCGRTFTRFRKQAALAERHYCTAECYYASLDKGYPGQWRQGCRLARALVAQHFALQPEHVVHHEDRDNRNNDLANLRVFASQADHMAYHRGRNVTPLWDGRQVRG